MMMTDNLHILKPELVEEDTSSTANTESLMTMSDLEDQFFAEPKTQKDTDEIKNTAKCQDMRKYADNENSLDEKNDLGIFSSTKPLYKEIKTDKSNKTKGGLENELLTDKYSSIVYEPYKLVEMNKLEFALKHLGVQFDLEQKNKIRASLYPDESGRVKYGDFVDAVQNILNLETFEDHKFILKSKTPKFSAKKVSTGKPFMHNTTNNTTNNTEKPKMAAKTEFDRESFVAFHRGEIERLKKERDEAIMELKRMRKEYKEKEQICTFLEDELIDSQTMRKVNEEEELDKRNRETEDSQKQSAILGCQLHKAELAKQTYEICIEQLISFVEKVQTAVEMLLKYSETKSKGHKKLLYLSKKSKDVMNVVQALTEDEPLPYGWEKAYTDDNLCYYVNHSTQTTSWIHPLTKNFGEKRKKLHTMTKFWENSIGVDTGVMGNGKSDIGSSETLLTGIYSKKGSSENLRPKTPVGPGSIKVQTETDF